MTPAQRLCRVLERTSYVRPDHICGNITKANRAIKLFRAAGMVPISAQRWAPGAGTLDWVLRQRKRSSCRLTSCERS